jgi:hypothetical protein
VGNLQNKMTTSLATLQLLKALAAFSPRDAQALRKPTFKMAKLANPDASGSDRAAGWNTTIKSYFGVHLYVINDKKKPQAVAMLKMIVFHESGVRAQLFAERTVAGMKSLDHAAGV